VLSRAQLVKTKDYDEAVAMVIKGDVTALLADWPICLVSVARYPEHELFTIVSPFTYEPIGVALPPDDPLLVNWVDNFLTKLEDSGAMDDLKDYWIENPQWIDKIK
jgi:polar amino acid transport system substrate-binding protein